MQNLFNYINWIALLVAALAFFLLGSIWYTKLLFAKKRLAYTKININDLYIKKGMGAIMFGSFLLMFVASAGLAILAAKLELSGGAILGAITGACFGATAISISYLYEKRALGLHLINGDYTLAGRIIAAIIICVCR